MDKGTTIRLLVVALCTCVFSSAGYAQGNNAPDPLVNLALVDGATVSGSIPNDQLRGIPEDILWDPSTNDWATASEWHENGMAFGETMAATKENPLYWQVVWTEPKNVNYIRCSGVYGNQPQPTTGTLSGVGYGSPTQTNWVWDGHLVWRGLEPVVTNGIRFTTYANSDSLADGKESFADSLWSFAWTGRDFGSGMPKTVLVQYLDFSDAEADNGLDPMINLALLDEAMVSANFKKGDFQDNSPIRNEPADLLYDLVKDDYHNKNTAWGWFGYPYDYDAGYPDGPDDGFIYMVEWPVPKNINYFTRGGCYGAKPQPLTQWAVEYWDGDAWVAAASGVGTDWTAGTWLYDSEGHEYGYNGLGVDIDTYSTWTSDPPIQTTKLRLAAWSGGIDPLWSLHIRGRGGQTKNWDERVWVNGYDPQGHRVIHYGADPIPTTFKAVLVQYRDLSAVAVETNKVMVATKFELHQNYPNPFNPETTIQFNLPKQGHVTLHIYDILGKQVSAIIDKQMSTGYHEIQFNAEGLASGIYFYQI